MKKLLLSLAALVMMLSAAESFACHISFNSTTLETAKVGDVITVEAIIVKEHRRCELADTDVHVELSEHLKILNETGWKAQGNEIRNTFQIKVLTEGDVIFRVFRECSKKGISEGTFIFHATK